MPYKVLKFELFIHKTGLKQEILFVAIKKEQLKNNPYLYSLIGTSCFPTYASIFISRFLLSVDFGFVRSIYPQRKSDGC